MNTGVLNSEKWSNLSAGLHTKWRLFPMISLKN